MSARRQPKNLKRILCSSRLKPVKRINRLRKKTHKGVDGWEKCEYIGMTTRKFKERMAEHRE